MSNLQRIRKEQGLTQQKLADLSGVHLAMIQKYEAYIKDINHAQAITIWQLAEALNCDMNELLEK